MTVRISRRGPGALSIPKRRGRFQQTRAADLPVTLGSELRPCYGTIKLCEPSGKPESFLMG